MELRLELFVNNIERSMEFYCGVLGFNVPKEIKSDYISIRKGDVVLGLGEMEKLPDSHPLKISRDDQQVGLGVEIVLKVEDVYEVYNHVLAKGYSIQSKLTKQSWGMVDFRIVDPDGYYLRITSNN